MSTLQKGTPVNVRCANGEIRKNIVWRDYGDVVMVCSKDQYDHLSKGHDRPMPIGFKRKDVMVEDV